MSRRVAPWRRFALLLILLVTVAGLPQQLATLRGALPVIAHWPDGHRQQRLQWDGVPYDLLQRAHTILPPGAPVLLVTPGTEVRGREYILFHRALYQMAPRAVWWLSPAPSDGTWESRWWISGPLTAAAIKAVASSQRIDCVLAVAVDLPPGLGRPVADLGEGELWQLGDGKRECLESGPARVATADFAGRGWPLALAAALGIIMAHGYGVLALLARLGHRVAGLEAAGLAWLFGAGLLSLGMFALHFLGLRLTTQRTVLTMLGMFPLILFLRRGPALTRWRLSPGRLKGFRLSGSSLFSALLLLLLVGQIVYVFLLAAGRPLIVWDSWVNWGMKGRIIFLENGITPAVYADPSRAVTLLDYPLFIPLLEAWLFSWLGAADDRFVGMLFVLCYLALIAILYGTGRRYGASRRFALLVTVAIGSLGHVVGLAATAYTDLFLAALLLTAAIYLFDWLVDGSPAVLLVAAVAAGLLPWTKREGAVLVAVLCLSCLAVTLYAGRFRSRGGIAMAAVALAAVLLAGPWWLFAGRHAIANDAFLPLTAATLGAGLERLPVIGWLMLTQLFSPKFGFVWLLLPLAAMWYWQRGDEARPTRERLAGLWPLTAVSYLGLMSLTYLFSDFNPFQQHVLTSVFRLASHVAPLPILWLAYGGVELREMEEPKRAEPSPALIGDV